MGLFVDEYVPGVQGELAENEGCSCFDLVPVVIQRLLQGHHVLQKGQLDQGELPINFSVALGDCLLEDLLQGDCAFGTLLGQSLDHY